MDINQDGKDDLIFWEGTPRPVRFKFRCHLESANIRRGKGPQHGNRIGKWNQRRLSADVNSLKLYTQLAFDNLKPIIMDLDGDGQMKSFCRILKKPLMT